MRRNAENIKRRIKRREDMFLRRLFGILAKMAKADGKVDAWETHAAEGAFARFPRADARRKFCAGVFNTAKNGRTSLERLAAEFAANWAKPEDCLAVYELLWDIACAKGVLRPVHKEALRKVCAPLGLPPNYFTFFFRRRRSTVREVSEEETREEQDQAEQRRRTRRGPSSRGKTSQQQGSRSEQRRQAPPPPPKTSLDEAYELLGCRRSDPNDVVRRAYRNAAKRYHPDLLRAKGRSESQVKDATEMMARVNAAWDLIKVARGL